MKIILTGASGLIGCELFQFLENQGHQIKKLVRDQKMKNKGIGYWDPDHHFLDPAELEGYDAVINLAGENISSGRWTKSKKEKILSSRINTTQLLASTLKSMSNPPSIFINASAIGYYGNRGNEELDENSVRGQGFLAKVCQEWEKAAEKAHQSNIRIVLLRFGVVLSEKGGTLKKLLLPFKMGLGGRLGSGEQYMSWISLDDLVGIVQYVLSQPSLSGPINTVSPSPITNKEFTQVLANTLNRPALLSIPAFAARFVFGEIADDLFLASAKVHPTRLLTGGYQFKFPKLEDALRHHLKI